MNLGIFLSPGDGLTKMTESGQDQRFVEFYLRNYLKYFNKIYVFSYLDEKYELLPNCVLVPNTLNWHRYLYTFFLPIQQSSYLKDCDVLRVTQFPGIIPAIVTKLLFKKPIVATYGFDYPYFAKLEKKWFQFILYNFVNLIGFRFVDYVITATLKLQKYLSKKISSQKVILIPNGTKIISKKIKKRKSNQDKIDVLTVGRLEVQKNHQALVQAINQSKFKKKIIITIVGLGSLKDHLLSLSEELDVTLRILDPLPFNQYEKVFEDKDIFVLPSLIEGHPKVLLDAMAASLACIATRTTGSDEIIKDKENGLLCGFTPESIQKALDNLVENEILREKIGKNGQETVKENYDIDKLLDKESKFLFQIAKRVSKDK